MMMVHVGPYLPCDELTDLYRFSLYSSCRKCTTLRVETADLEIPVRLVGSK